MPATLPTIFSDSGMPDQEAYLYARAQRLDLTTDTLVDVEQADVASIAWTVKVERTGAAVANGTFSASDVVFDTLLTSADIDDSNFRGRFAGTCFPDAGTTYQVRVVITLNGTPTNTVEIVVNYKTLGVV